MDAADEASDEQDAGRPAAPQMAPAAMARRSRPFRPAAPDRLSVCLFTDSLAPSGVGEHMLALIRGLRRTCRFSVAGMRSPESRRLLRRAADLGCDTLAMPRWDQPESWTELGRFLEEQRPDILHIHAGVGWEGLPAPYVARTAG